MPRWRTRRWSVLAQAGKDGRSVIAPRLPWRLRPCQRRGDILPDMRALWLEDRRLRLRDDVPIPAAPSGEALVRVIRAGICNTDIELTQGYYPFTGIPGHEFVGVVEQGPSALVGRRVVGEINAVCGACRACLAGRRTHCERRTVLGIVSRHGAFADYLVLPAENLHSIPDAVSTDAGLFTEPLAAALEIQEQVPIGSRDRVLVVGDGKLGQLVAQTLALTGCALLVVGRHDAKLAVFATRGHRDRARRPSDARGVRRGRRMHRQSRRVRGGPTRRATPRHARAEEHLCRRVDPRCLSGRGAGADARGLALRAVPTGAPAPRGGTGGRRPLGPRALPARPCPHGVRARTATRGAESTAGHRLGLARRLCRPPHQTSVVRMLISDVSVR